MVHGSRWWSRSSVQMEIASTVAFSSAPNIRSSLRYSATFSKNLRWSRWLGYSPDWEAGFQERSCLLGGFPVHVGGIPCRSIHGHLGHLGHSIDALGWTVTHGKCSGRAADQLQSFWAEVSTGIMKQFTELMMDIGQEMQLVERIDGRRRFLWIVWVLLEQ